MHHVPSVCADGTTNASSTPAANHSHSAVSNTPVAPITTHPNTTEHPNNSSAAVSVSSAPKPTVDHQKASNSTGTTPYPLVPYWLDWVPGWGIALLVLASLILLLLIILIILLVRTEE